jgi:hypothetical protein
LQFAIPSRIGWSARAGWAGTPAAHDDLDGLLECIGAEFGVTLADLRSGSKRGVLVQERAPSAR